MQQDDFTNLTKRVVMNEYYDGGEAIYTFEYMGKKVTVKSTKAFLSPAAVNTAICEQTMMLAKLTKKVWDQKLQVLLEQYRQEFGEL